MSATSISSGLLIALFTTCCSAKQTDFCVYLSLILLLGLILNATLGWWWADPISALIMVPIIAKEGIASLKGETCCDRSACCE